LRYRKAKNPYFYCNERYTTGDENCVSQVNVFFLEQVLLAALQKEIRRQMELEEVWSQYQEVQKEKYHVKRDKLQKSQQALDAVGKEQITLYERYGKREIQREEYIEFREELQKKEDFIKSEIQEQEMRLAEVETEFHAELPDAHIIWKECKINELNQEVVDTFIKKINVWDEQHMEIIWNFSDGKE
jgi:site-specific DNA recombinase